MPELNHFMNEGVLYKNAFTANSWANIGSWLLRIPRKVYEKSGYSFPGLQWNIPTLRKFGFNKTADFPVPFFILLPVSPKKFHRGVKYIFQELSKKQTQPFFLQIHFKELHPPLYRAENKQLSLQSRALIERYSQNPEKYADKAVLFSVLFDDELRVYHSPQVLSALNTLIQNQKLPREINLLKFVNLTDMPLMLDLWKKSPDYDKDLLLLKELYRINQTELDKKLKMFFSFFTKQKLKDNTLFVVCGNFGFGFMEHNFLFNSVANYDEFIGTHLFIKKPGDQSLTIVPQQASLKSAAKYIYELLENPQADPKTIIDEELLSTNYNADKVALRLNNQWKYHLELSNSVRELYDLKKDPNEKTNVLNENKNLSAELEKLLLDKLIQEKRDQ